jgi:hypothetical protein
MRMEPPSARPVAYRRRVGVPPYTVYDCLMSLTIEFLSLHWFNPISVCYYWELRSAITILNIIFSV